MQVSRSFERIIGKKQVGGWKQAPVETWRSNPGKQSVELLTAVEFAVDSVIVDGSAA
jgi:hypothetical protein